MEKFAIAEVQKIHNSVFGCNATNRDILKYLKEAEETLMLCKQQITPENIKELLVFWFNEEKKEAQAEWREYTRLMLDDA